MNLIYYPLVSIDRMINNKYSMRIYNHMVGRKQYTVATTVSESEYKWIQDKVNGGQVLNQSDLLRMALRKYMEWDIERNGPITVERRVRLQGEED
jgi:Arc/MetJ-type ribon-helix-helix transcriptional regulator